MKKAFFLLLTLIAVSLTSNSQDLLHLKASKSALIYPRTQQSGMLHLIVEGVYQTSQGFKIEGHYYEELQDSTLLQITPGFNYPVTNEQVNQIALMCQQQIPSNATEIQRRYIQLFFGTKYILGLEQDYGLGIDDWVMYIPPNN